MSKPSPAKTSPAKTNSAKTGPAKAGPAKAPEPAPASGKSFSWTTTRSSARDWPS